MKRGASGLSKLISQYIAAVAAKRVLALGIALFLGSWGAYIANSRIIATTDSVATSLVPFALWQDGTIRLDRYVGASYPESAYCFYRSGDGHWYNIYPIGAALVAAPLYWPVLFFRDLDPGAPILTLSWARKAEKYAAATIAALAVALLFDLLRHATSPGRGAGLAAIFGLATPMFTVAGQALFQHGPAALTLIAALRLLLVGTPGPGAAVTAGGLAALLAAIRPPDGLFGVLLAVIAWRHGRRVSIPFAAAAMAGGALLVAFNLAVFGSLAGGYARFDPPPRFDFQWSALAGLVASPRGILFVCPFLPLLFVRWRRPAFLKPVEVGAAALVIAGTLFFHAGQWSWWGGENFGARFWIDCLPLLFLLGSRALDGAQSIGLKAAWAATVGLAFLIQVVGALTFPKGETGFSSDLESATWSLNRSPLRLAFTAGLSHVELWPLTKLGPQGPLPPEGATARIHLSGPTRFWNREGLREVELEVWNTGTSRWSGRGGPFGEFAVRVHSWWRTGDGSYYRDSSVSLGGDLGPGERRMLRLAILGPRRTGTYIWALSVAETRAGGYRLLDGPDSKISQIVRVVERGVDIGQLEAAAADGLFGDGFESGATSSWSETADRSSEEGSADASGPPP